MTVALNGVVVTVLVIVAAIHLLPSIGVLGGPRLGALYAIDASAPDLAILLRHRAVLFALLGAFLLWAAAVPGLRAAGLVAGTVSVLAYLVIFAAEGGGNGALARVAAVDRFALAALLVGGLAQGALAVR